MNSGREARGWPLNSPLSLQDRLPLRKRRIAVISLFGNRALRDGEGENKPESVRYGIGNRPYIQSRGTANVGNTRMRRLYRNGGYQRNGRKICHWGCMAKKSGQRMSCPGALGKEQPLYMAGVRERLSAYISEKSSLRNGDI